MDFRINYHCQGQGVPFIFQHGLASNLDQPQKLLAGIGNIKLISMDCPGHGSSPLPKNTQPSFRFYADQLMILMEILKVKKAILGGISMGAGIALNTALRYPDKVSALVLVRPAWLDRGKPENLEILLEASRYINLQNGLQEFSGGNSMRTLQEKLPLAAQSVLGVFDPSQREEISLVLESMVKDHPFDNLSALDHIDIPCLIIGNEDDPLHPLELAEQIHQHIPGSQMHQIISRYLDDVQHGVAINKIVSKFINNHEKLLEG